MANEICELRGQIESCRRDLAQRRCFDASLKARIASFARARRSSGETIGQLSESLGISENQLYRWMRRYSESPAGFLPVRVVDRGAPAPEQAVLRRSTTPELRLISPSGWTVEGLDVQTLSVLLSRLP